MTSEDLLTRKLQERIRASGAITFRKWMEIALYDPDQGYYCNPGLTRWGRAGDYRTSPERSKLFAATFVRYFQTLYERLGAPDGWTIVEAGAGAGDFAFGVLERLQERSSQLAKRTTYVIDERSADSERLLRERLKPYETNVHFASLDSIAPLDPGVIFANELLDALPVHRVTVHNERPYEYYVGLDDRGQFSWQLGPLSDPRLAEHLKRPDLQLTADQIAEINLEAEDWLRLAGNQISKGFLVLVDYGAEASRLYDPSTRPKGSLRSFRGHQFAENLLANPGKQDLTTTIDWSLVKTTTASLGFTVIEFAEQDKFLINAGILDELNVLTDATASEAERMSLRTQSREMILPTGMAADFQVMVLGKGV